MRVDSRGLEDSATLHIPWFVSSVGVGIGIRRRRIGFFGAVEAAILLHKPLIFIGIEDVFRSPPVSPRVMIGIEFFFVHSSASSRT